MCAFPYSICTSVVFFSHREAPDSPPLHATNVMAFPSTMAPRISSPLHHFHPRAQTTNQTHPAPKTRCNQDALDSNGTTYFEEDLADAQEAVAECLKLYNETLDALDDKRKGETQRSMGMKMEQLKVCHHC